MEIRPTYHIFLEDVTVKRHIFLLDLMYDMLASFIGINATVNNISAISWQSVLFMEDKVQDFRIYLIALRCEGVIIPQKNCCSRIIKKLMPIIFQDVTGNSFFRPKISDVSTFTFDLPIKWTRVAAENRVGRVTVNRHIFYFGLNTFL